MTFGPLLLNRNQAPSGTSDATTSGALSSGALAVTFTSVPTWWPATGLLRGVLWKVGDTDWEYVDVDLATRSTSTFSLARETEDRLLHPASAHSTGAGFWVLATAAMLQAPADVGYEDLCTGDATLTPGATWVDVPGVTRQLPPGVWDIRAMALLDYQGVGGGSGSIAFRITDGTNNYFGGETILSPGWVQTITSVKRITLTAATTIKMQGQAQTAGTHIRRYRQVSGGTEPGTLLQCFPVGGTPAITEYVYIRDEKAQGTDGGSFANAAWRTRVLNTKVKDTGGIATLAANQITLPAGDYYIRASAPTYQVHTNKLRLYNITDSAVLLIGQDARDDGTAGDSGSIAMLEGPFTLTAPKTIELQHQGSQTSNTFGFGVAANFTGAIEVYAEVHLWRGAAVTGGPFGGAGSPGGLVLLEKHTASGSATLDFTNFISNLYDEYQIELVSIVPATNGATLQVQVGTGGVPTYDTGGNYDWVYTRVSQGGTVFGAGHVNDTQIGLAEGISNADSAQGTYKFFDPQSTTVKKRFVGDITIVQNDGNFYRVMFGGQWKTAGTAATALRFLMSSGNIASGTIRVYGIAK